MRKLSKYMLKRKVVAWGWYGPNRIIIEFADGKLALVDPLKREYSSIKAWNPFNRLHYLAHAKRSFHGRLEELIERVARHAQ